MTDEFLDSSFFWEVKTCFQKNCWHKVFLVFSLKPVLVRLFPCVSVYVRERYWSKLFCSFLSSFTSRTWPMHCKSHRDKKLNQNYISAYPLRSKNLVYSFFRHLVDKKPDKPVIRNKTERDNILNIQDVDIKSQSCSVKFMNHNTFL